MAELLVTNQNEIEPLEKFRTRYKDSKQEENKLEIEILKIDILQLKVKLELKIAEFRSGNSKPNRKNTELIKDIHHISNRIIEKQCKINEFNSLFDSATTIDNRQLI